MHPEEPKIQSDLRDLRIWRFLCNFPLLAVVLMLALDASTGRFLDLDIWEFQLYRVLWFLFCVWAVAGIILGIPLHTQSCPLCGNRFHARTVRWGFNYTNTFVRTCMHCGLNLSGNNLENVYNKGFNRTPESSGPAKPGESGGGAG